MSKELYFTDGNNEVKYLDTTASFNLAITQDGSAFDLTNATAIDVKVANDTGYVFDKSIDMTTIKQPLAGLITMPVDAEVMNALVPDDYTIEVWVTLSSLITPGSQEGLTDTSTDGSTTDTTTSTTTDNTTTYNAIFPSDDPQGFTITENVMSDSGDVIPVMSLDAFQQEFEQLKTDLTNQVSTLQGPAGKDGENGKDGATGPQGPQGIQGPKGDTGQGLEIKGKVDTTSQLPETASEGDGYLVAEELYIWTDNAWKDCGQIQGPAGKDGATGPQGPKGDTGATGAQGTPGVQGPKGDTGETGPAGKDGTAKFEELAEGTDLFSLVVNDAQSHYYLCSSNASAKTLKNSPVATAFSLELYPANTPQSVASNGVAEWAYTQMVLRPFNSSTAWIASTNSDGDGNISNTAWVQVASMSDVTTAISTATANMVSNVKGDTSWESIDGFKKFVHKPADSEGYTFMTSEDVNDAISPLEQKINDTGWQPLVSKDSSSAAFSSSSYYRIVNGILYVHGTISVLNTTNLHYQLWDIPTGWSISDKAGTQIIYPDSTAYNNYVQLLSGSGTSYGGGLLVYEDKTGYSTDFRFVTPVDRA